MNPWADYYAKADNVRSRPKRAEFWETIIARTAPVSVLEVGCGDGLNLEHIAAGSVAGIDAYAPALERARARLGPFVDLRPGDASDLVDVPGLSVDLVFSCTTLQHIADDTKCQDAMQELLRISRRWVLVMEYEAKERTPVAWRGDPEGIVKRPWGKMLEAAGGEIRATGFLCNDDGFDDVTWYLARR